MNPGFSRQFIVGSSHALPFDANGPAQRRTGSFTATALFPFGPLNTPHVR